MENTILVTMENVLQTINSGSFGSIQIEFDNDQTKTLMEKAVNAARKIMPYSVNMKEDTTSIANDKYNERSKKYTTDWTVKKIEGKYRLYFTREYKKDMITENDYMIEKFAMECLVKNSTVILPINKKMYPEARKIAKEYLIKTTFKGLDFCFEKKEGLSVLDQIRNAYKSGLSTLIFDIDSTSVHTIRAYCSLVKNETISNIYCRVEGNKIVVYLKPLSVCERIMKDFKTIVSECKTNLDKKQIIQLYQYFENELGLTQIQDWEKFGFNSDAEYKDFIGEEVTTKENFKTHDFDDFSDAQEEF